MKPMKKTSKKNNNKEQQISTLDQKDKVIPQKVKPVYVKKRVPIMYADYCAAYMDSIYNLLDSITFDKISIPVKMSRAEFSDDKSLKGSIIIGNVIKFNNDNTFTVSMSEDNAKTVKDNALMSIRFRKNKATGEASYITELTITHNGISVEEHYKDIEEAFNSANDENPE